MKMAKLRRGGYALMRTIQGQPPIPVHWYRAKDTARVYDKPTIFSHKYGGTSKYANVKCDCEAFQNPTFNGLGMQFPFAFDECNCPDWYPYATSTPPVDCAGLAPLGSDRVARFGADPARDPIFVTGEGGLLPCCTKLPRPISYGWVDGNPGIGLDNVFIPAGLAGDLLIAIMLRPIPTVTALPPGWTTYATGTVDMGSGLRWSVYTATLASPDADEFRWDEFQTNANGGLLARYQWAGPPYSYTTYPQYGPLLTWQPAPAPSDRASTILWAAIRYLVLENVTGPPDSEQWPEDPVYDDKPVRVFARDAFTGTITPTVYGSVHDELGVPSVNTLTLTLVLPAIEPS